MSRIILCLSIFLSFSSFSFEDPTKALTLDEIQLLPIVKCEDKTWFYGLPERHCHLIDKNIEINIRRLKARGHGLLASDTEAPLSIAEHPDETTVYDLCFKGKRENVVFLINHLFDHLGRWDHDNFYFRAELKGENLISVQSVDGTGLNESIVPDVEHGIDYIKSDIKRCSGGS